MHPLYNSWCAFVVLLLAPTLLSAETVTKLPRSQYSLYSVCSLNFTLAPGAQTEMFASNFSLAHGGFQAQEIAAVKVVHPNCILVNYMNRTTSTRRLKCPRPKRLFQYQVLKFTPTVQNTPAVSGPKADPDQDGIKNIIKYATGRKALVANPADAPAVAVNSNHLPLTYTGLIAAADVTYQPEVSTDSITWNAGASFITTVSTTDNGDGTTQTVVVSDNTPITCTSKRFMRLKVILNLI